MGVGLPILVRGGGLLERALRLCPRRQGTIQRAGFRLTIVGRLVTVPGQRAGRQSPLCLCLSGWALQPPVPLPGFHPSPACGVVCAPHPAPWINPLLPAVYLPPGGHILTRLWGHIRRPLGSRARACVTSSASPRRRLWHGPVTVAQQRLEPGQRFPW